MIRALRAGVGAARLGIYVLLLCAPGGTGAAWSDPVPLRATVVWTRADRVYLAASDSAALETGTLLSFEYRGKTVATGEVTAVSNGELIAARLMTGSLRKIKKLDRIRVTATRAQIPRASILRIGYPSASRPSLLFACDSMTLRPVGPGSFYRAEERGQRAYRLVRSTDSTGGAPWPDTLLIRLFDEAADEEIALERGELDAGVFWPGEASTHIREATRWKGEIKGTRARGVLAVFGNRPAADSFPSSPPGRRLFESLNDGLFRGDLVPCGLPGRDTPGDSASTLLPRIQVATGPGRQVLEQFLNRQLGSPNASPATGVVNLIYLPSATGTLGAHGSSSLFRIGCPVLSRPELRPYLTALGPDALVNLLDCATTGRE